LSSHHQRKKKKKKLAGGHLSKKQKRRERLQGYSGGEVSHCTSLMNWQKNLRAKKGQAQKLTPEKGNIRKVKVESAFSGRKKEARGEKLERP